jgi:hypothetical protein
MYISALHHLAKSGKVRKTTRRTAYNVHQLSDVPPILQVQMNVISDVADLFTSGDKKTLLEFMHLIGHYRFLFSESIRFVAYSIRHSKQ